MAPPPLRRSTDAGEINPILNDPDVFPLIALPGQERIDVTELVADQRNVLLMADGGGILFAQQEPGIYEAHVNFLKAYRGQNAINETIAACRWMFMHTDCLTLLARAPMHFPAIARLCKAIGGTCEFSRSNLWPLRDGTFSDVEFWALRYDDWVRQADGLIGFGHAFNMRLIDEFSRLGAAWEVPPINDNAQETRIGACAEMIYGGQPEKAVILYNRWARWAWRNTISLVARDPIIVDIGDAVLMFGEKDFKVLKVRT